MLRDFYIYIWWAIDLGGRFGLWFDKKQRRVSLEGRVLIHYSGVIINAMASQIIGVSINCSTFCSGPYQRKHQSSASLAFLRRIHRRPVNSQQRSSYVKNVSIWCRHHVTKSTGFFKRVAMARWEGTRGLSQYKDYLLTIKMSPYQYRNLYYKDKTVSRPSYLYNGNPHTWKDGLYIEKEHRILVPAIGKIALGDCHPSRPFDAWGLWHYITGHNTHGETRPQNHSITGIPLLIEFVSKYVRINFPAAAVSGANFLSDHYIFLRI